MSRFLSFGYARRNIERLQLAECMKPKTHVFVCIKGFTPQQARVLIRPHFQNWPAQVGIRGEDIVQFFRHSPELLT